jgi:hypothetical protein
MDASFVAASFRRSAPMSAMQTFMPSLTNRIAAASPMPEAPPVITATLFGDMAAWGMDVPPDKSRIYEAGVAPTMHEPAWEVFVPRICH